MSEQQVRRYALGVFHGAPAMFEQADGKYVKYSDVAGWHKLSERLPEVKQTVLVKSESWSHPRVLCYEDFPHQRLIDREQGIHYWHPERMHWMSLPSLTAENAEFIEAAEAIRINAVMLPGTDGGEMVIARDKFDVLMAVLDRAAGA